MAEWRFARGWSEGELAERLEWARRSTRNFDEPDRRMTPERGWSRHASTAVIAREPPGRPEADGPFERAWPSLVGYAFSDPRIVRGHFDPDAPLLGRVMLLEIRVLGLRYLGAVIVSALRADSDAERTVRGYRYDTLEGHFERGSEWFQIIKDHASGAVTFNILAGWRRGELPNAWSRLGFRLLAQHYQRTWHRLAHLRMRALLGSVDLDPVPRGARLVTAGPPLPDTHLEEWTPIRARDETPPAGAEETS